jgi:hypothetical protein
VQDLGGWQDDHDEKDVEESQRGSGQDAPASRCPLEQQLLGPCPQWHRKGKAPIYFEATCIHDSPVPLPHSNWAAVQLQDHMQSGLQEECWRSAERWCTSISVAI